jgi:Acyl-coenzyme A:6-aminopenicillanic acid acyl-transferase
MPEPMSMPIAPDVNEQSKTPPDAPGRSWRRMLRWVLIVVVISVLGMAYLLKDHVRTLQSLRRVPGTNAYVMDYYVDYNIGEIRSQGMDVKNVENGLIRVFCPDIILPIAFWAKGQYLDDEVDTVPPEGHRCSTVVWRTDGGNVFFGRNFDWKHDACLILKIHDRDSVTSIAALDLHYLNLDRGDLETTSFIERIPLLFAPYYLQDGMNRHGVAVADMSVDAVRAPSAANRPDILHSTAMRLILDYAKTTDEAVALLKEYNIHFGETICHLMIADATGKSAVVEFLDGNIVATTTQENWQVCTNHQISGKSEDENDRTCSRYRTASDQLAALTSAAGAADVMQVMQAVAQPNWTMWSSVYELSTGELQFAYRQHFGESYQDGLPIAD